MYSNKSVSMKVVVLLLAVVLLVGCTIGGTLAWLTANSGPVENTFTVGKIEISLDEKDTENVVYKIVPGASQDKKPVVTVKSGSEKCYVYVLVDNQLGSDVTLDIDTSQWTSIATSGAKTLYRYSTVVDAASTEQTCTVFTKVTYAKTIDETSITALSGKKITIDAYAHQSEHLDNENIADIAAKDYFDLS